MGSENVLRTRSDDEQAVHEIVSGYYDTFVNDPIAAATYYGEPTLVVLPNARNPTHEVNAAPSDAKAAGAAFAVSRYA